MKKFVLEVELHDEWGCHGCICNDRYRDSPNPGYFCFVADNPGLLEGERPAWCPLKEVEEE